MMLSRCWRDPGFRRRCCIGVVRAHRRGARGRSPGDRRGPAAGPGYSAKTARMVADRCRRQAASTPSMRAGVSSSPIRAVVDLQQVVLGFRDASGAGAGPRAPTAVSWPRTAASSSSTATVHVYGRRAGHDGAAAEMTTEQPGVRYQRRRSSTTRDPVTLVWRGRKLNAPGMVANLKEHRVQLESAVHGTFSAAESQRLLALLACAAAASAAAPRRRSAAKPAPALVRSPGDAARSTSMPPPSRSITRPIPTVFNDVVISQGETRVQAEHARATGLNFANSKWTFEGNVRIDARAARQPALGLRRR